MAVRKGIIRGKFWILGLEGKKVRNDESALIISAGLSWACPTCGAQHPSRFDPWEPPSWAVQHATLGTKREQSTLASIGKPAPSCVWALRQIGTQRLDAPGGGMTRGGLQGLASPAGTHGDTHPYTTRTLYAQRDSCRTMWRPRVWHERKSGHLCAPVP